MFLLHHTLVFLSYFSISAKIVLPVIALCYSQHCSQPGGNKINSLIGNQSPLLVHVQISRKNVLPHLSWKFMISLSIAVCSSQKPAAIPRTGTTLCCNPDRPLGIEQNLTNRKMQSQCKVQYHKTQHIYYQTHSTSASVIH